MPGTAFRVLVFATALCAAPALPAQTAPAPTEPAPSAPASTTQPGPPQPAPLQMAPDVYLLAGAFVPGAQPDSNTLVFASAGGLVVFDTGRHLAHTQRIVDLARAAWRPVTVVVNSHWHLDHTGGNVLLRREYPDLRVHASGAGAAAEQGFLANYRRQLEGMLGTGAPAATEAQRSGWRAELALLEASAQRAPDELIAATGRRTLAGREFVVGLEPYAATAGDVWVLDVASGVLAAGDLVTLPVPFLDTACAPGWQDALDRLSQLQWEQLVPGHGPPLDRAQFERWRGAYGALLSCAESIVPKAQCADRWLAGVGDLVPAEQHELTHQMLDYYLDRNLRGDYVEAAALCGVTMQPSRTPGNGSVP